LVAAIVAMSACGEASSPPPARNLLLITVDTLRADRLGAWGHDEPTSPSLDAFARDAVRFRNARSTSSWTLPSLASLLTSLHASTLAIWNYQSSLADSFTTLAERLGDQDFRTAGVGSHTFLAERFGLQQGFDDFDDELVLESLSASHKAISSDLVTDRALAYLDAQPPDGPRWFLWVHYFDPHRPYLTHPGISEAFGTETPEQRYHGEIAFTDREIGRLLDGLADFGLADDTLVIFTSDHGEEFGEHGWTGHGKHLYREIVDVPLLVRAPGIAPREVNELVSLVDVPPTTLDLLGLPVPEGLAGQSLMPAMLGEALASEPAIAETRLFGQWDSIEQDSWRLLRLEGGGRFQLFDRESDPSDQRDVASANPEVVKELRGQLERRLTAATALAPEPGADSTPALTDEQLESLRNLGYVEEDGTRDSTPGRGLSVLKNRASPEPRTPPPPASER
jgi:arylsulfatase A-like enzyme